MNKMKVRYKKGNNRDDYETEFERELFIETCYELENVDTNKNLSLDK